MDAMKLYKLSRFFYLNGFGIISKVITKVNNVFHNSHIPHTALIGEKSRFGYGGIGVVIHKNSKIGKNCTIGQNCTIGGRTGHGGPPIIGDNVFIGPGARLLGGFKIGDNVIIGANAVVLTDVPDNSVVAGVPAKVISNQISKFKNENII